MWECHFIGLCTTWHLTSFDVLMTSSTNPFRIVHTFFPSDTKFDWCIKIWVEWMFMTSNHTSFVPKLITASTHNSGPHLIFSWSCLIRPSMVFNLFTLCFCFVCFSFSLTNCGFFCLCIFLACLFFFNKIWVLFPFSGLSLFFFHIIWVCFSVYFLSFIFFLFYFETTFSVSCAFSLAYL